MGDVYTLLCRRSVMRLAKGTYAIPNICSDASRVQGGWNLAKTRVRT